MTDRVLPPINFFAPFLIAPKLKPAVSSGSVHKQANYVQDDMVLLNNASRSSLFNQTITAARSVNDLGKKKNVYIFSWY